MYSVLSNGKDAVIPGWVGCEQCHYHTFKEAISYAQKWIGGSHQLPNDWDGAPYSVGGIITIEIRNTNTALTDQEVIDLFNANGAWAFHFEKLCSRCGEKWISHINMKCQAYPFTTFMPVNDPQVNGCEGCGTSCDGCKGHANKDSTTTPTTTKEEMPEWKRWRNDKPGECPCGMPRENCWIHRI